MADFPALPLWTDALAADTDHLTHEEYGLYQRMLNVAWRLSSCDLPNDAKWLMRRFRLSSVQYDELCQPIIDEFWTLNQKGRLEQKRLKRERNYVAEKSETNRRSATKRWDKTKKDYANAMRMQCERNAPTPTPTPIDSEPIGSGAVAPEPEDLKSRIFGPALAWMAKHTGKTERSLRSMLGKWCRDHGDGAVLEALQNAARAGPIEPVSWIEAKLSGTAKQVFGQPFKTSELLERMAEDEADGFGEEGDLGGDGDALPRALAGPERGTGGGVPEGDHRQLGAVQPNGGGVGEHVGEVQAPLDEDDVADAGGTVSGAFH